MLYPMLPSAEQSAFRVLLPNKVNGAGPGPSSWQRMQKYTRLLPFVLLTPHFCVSG